MKLAEMIYLTTNAFPKEEIYGITSQIRRSSVSIAANIAEGKGRYHTKVYTQFLYQARGSLYETISLIQLSMKLGYILPENEKNLLEAAATVSRQLSGLINSMK